MAWLAVDAGTSAIKAIVLDRTGRQVAAGRSAVPISRRGPGYAEQDLEQVWQAVVSACRSAQLEHQAAHRPGGGIEGIVTTAQGDGAWLIDGDGLPAGPAILWNDGRAQEEIDEIRATGKVERAFRVSGSVPYPGLPCAILPWLARHQPEVLARSRWLLSANGWLHFRLTGAILAELSDASNPFSNIRKRGYSDELLSLYGVAGHRSLLPPIRSVPVSPLREAAARELGIDSPDLPVVMAPYDIVSTAAGCGSTEPGEGCLILGTTISAEAIVEDPGFEREPSGTTIALGDGNYLRAMPTLTGCEALAWACSLFGLHLDEFSRLAAHAPLGANNLLFLPYLSPAGERSPFLAPDAKGSFHGLSLTHTREDMARAIFEGLCFAIRECLLVASSRTLSVLAVCGGGARSDFWCQMIADVCGTVVRRPSEAELGAVGAWRHALVATGAAASLKDSAEGQRNSGTRFEPSASSGDSYRELFDRFLEVRRVASGIWNQMHPGSRHSAGRVRP